MARGSQESAPRPPPDPTETVYLGCPQCRADSLLPPRCGAPGQWYWCGACGQEWSEDGPEWGRPGARELAAVVLTVAMMMALLFGEGALILGWMLPHFPATEDGQAMAVLVSIGLVFIPWIASIWLLHRVMFWITEFSHVAWRYVWGRSL